MRDTTGKSRKDASVKNSMNESGKSRHGSTDGSQVGAGRAYAPENTSNRWIFYFQREEMRTSASDKESDSAFGLTVARRYKYAYLAYAYIEYVIT